MNMNIIKATLTGSFLFNTLFTRVFILFFKYLSLQLYSAKSGSINTLHKEKYNEPSLNNMNNNYLNQALIDNLKK